MKNWNFNLTHLVEMDTMFQHLKMQGKKNRKEKKTWNMIMKHALNMARAWCHASYVGAAWFVYLGSYFQRAANWRSEKICLMIAKVAYNRKKFHSRRQKLWVMSNR